MKKLEINSDITVARCMPAEFYRDERYFQLSKSLIFERSWQYAGTRKEGFNLLPVDLLIGFLDEPLLITDSDEVRCVSNVCSHRGNILVPEECTAAGIKCGYHGRRFDLSGKFVSMPEFEGVKDFPRPEDNLKSVDIKEWAGMLFVSLDAEAEFGDFLAPVFERFSGFQIAAGASVSTKEYEINAHWALYCENYLEGFHIPFVHRGLNREIEFDSYRTETFRYSSLQTALAVNDDGVEEDRDEYSDAFTGSAAAYYYFIFPNLMFNFYPWGLSVNIVEPVSPVFTRVRYIKIVVDPTKENKGAGADLETVELEDQGVVEAVQKGIGSRLYQAGRYSATREKGTHHFHRLIAEFMNRGESE